MSLFVLLGLLLVLLVGAEPLSAIQRTALFSFYDAIACPASRCSVWPTGRVHGHQRDAGVRQRHGGVTERQQQLENSQAHGHHGHGDRRAGASDVADAARQRLAVDARERVVVALAIGHARFGVEQLYRQRSAVLHWQRQRSPEPAAGVKRPLCAPERCPLHCVALSERAAESARRQP